MNDDEILTKRLSDWKPETDIKLQKAFGKFVEEAGELQEASYNFVINNPEADLITPLENELADCLAFIACIESMTGIDTSIFVASYNDFVRSQNANGVDIENETVVVLMLHKDLGKTLTIIGRCQIQGIYKNNPETHRPNLTVLEEHLVSLQYTIMNTIRCFNLDVKRIMKRKQAKIDSKMPWILGTANNLLPDT